MLQYNEDAWFARKKYGIGWGMPRRWQGWLVYVGYVFLVVGLAPMIRERSQTLYVGCVVALTVLLVAILVMKGERSLWRGPKESSKVTGRDT